LIDEAAAHYQAALNVRPSSPTFQAKLGKALLRKGLNDEAIVHFQKTIELASHRTNTERAELQSDIGNELLQKGLVDEAIVQFQQALELAPTDRIIHNDYGNALLRKGRVDEAIVQFQKALDSGVEDALCAHYSLQSRQRSSTEETAERSGRTISGALKRAPRLVAAQNNLAWILATAPDASLRNGSQALELATQANQLSGGRDPVILRTLAAAYAENRQFSKAFESAKSALHLAITQRNQALMEALQHDISLIRQGCLIASPDRYRICRLTQTFDKANNSNFGVFAFQKNRNASLDRSSFTYHSFAHWNQWLRPCPKLKPAFLRLSAMISQDVILGFAR